MRRSSLFIVSTAALLGVALQPGCSTYRQTESGPTPELREADARTTLADFRAQDPTLSRFFDSALAYAVYPDVTKGGLGIGAANGSGVVFEGGRAVGFSTLTQVTLGAQIGGQSFSEVVFFENADSFGKFKAGTTEFAANASAVASSSGAAASNDYKGGVAVFVIPRGGLMAEASLGGQKFTYRPK